MTGISGWTQPMLKWRYRLSWSGYIAAKKAVNAQGLDAAWRPAPEVAN